MKAYVSVQNTRTEEAVPTGMYYITDELGNHVTAQSIKRVFGKIKTKQCGT